MARTRLINGKPIPLTSEEETARDAEEQAYITAAPPPLPLPTDMEVLRRALQNKGGPVITDADIDTARQALMIK